MLSHGRFFRTTLLFLAILESMGVVSATEISNDTSYSNWSTDLSDYTSGAISYTFNTSTEDNICALFTDSNSNGSYDLTGEINVTLNGSTANRVLGIYSANTTSITSSDPVVITLQSTSSASGNVGGIVASEGGSVDTGNIAISILSSSANAYVMGIYGANSSTVDSADVSITFNSSSSALSGMAGVILINGAQAEVGTVSVQLTGSTIGSSDSSATTSTPTNFYGIYTGLDESYALETGLTGSYANVKATSSTITISGSSVNGDANVYGTFASNGTSIQISNSVDLEINSSSSLGGEAYGIYATGQGSVSSGSVALTLSGTSTINGSLYGIAAVSEGVVNTGSITLNLQGGNVTSSSDNTTNATANAYGIFVSSDGSSVTADNLSIYVSEAASLQAALFGIRATEQGTANVGDVFISIENSTAGPNPSTTSQIAGISGMGEGTSVSAKSVSVELTGYSVINSVLYGVRASNGAVVSTTGEVNLVIQNSSVGLNVYGVYSSELGQVNTGNVTVSITGSSSSSEGNTASVGGNIYGANVLGTSILGDVTVKGSDFYVAGSVYSIYDTGTIGQASEPQAGDVFIRLTNATIDGSIGGSYTDATASGSYSVGDIEMEIVDTTLTNAGNIFGHATYATSEASEATYNMTASISSVSLTVTSTGTSDDPAGDVVAVYKQDAGVLNVNGTTGLWISDSITNGVAGAVVANGSANLQNVTLVLTNVASTYGTAGLWIGQTPDSGTQTVDSISVAVNGNINVTFLAGSETSPGLTQNLYGVVIANGSTGSITQTGSLNVSLVGDASIIQGGSYTIYGNAIGSTSSTYNLNGTRTLYFGSSASSQNYGFTSSVQNPLLPSFANFDSIVVRSGSTLFITSEQNGSLSAEASVFGTGVTSISSSYLDGIVSKGGTIELPANTTLLVDTDALANIHEVDNNGTVCVYENGTLVLHQGSSSSSITGQGTVIFSPEASIETYGIATANVSISTTSTTGHFYKFMGFG